MQKKTVAERYGLYPQRVETLYNSYTRTPFELRCAIAAEAIPIDETSIRKGHNYITTFWNAHTGQLLDIRSGRSSSVIKSYAAEVEAEQGRSAHQSIKEVVCDMSPAYFQGRKCDLSQILSKKKTAGFSIFGVLKHLYLSCKATTKMQRFCSARQKRGPGYGHGETF